MGGSGSSCKFSLAPVPGCNLRNPGGWPLDHRPCQFKGKHYQQPRVMLKVSALDIYQVLGMFDKALRGTWSDLGNLILSVYGIGSLTLMATGDWNGLKVMEVALYWWQTHVKPPQFPVTFEKQTNGFIYSKFHKDPEKSSRIMIRLDDASLISSGSFLMVVMKLRLVDFRFASGPGFGGFAGCSPAGWPLAKSHINRHLNGKIHGTKCWVLQPCLIIV